MDLEKAFQEKWLNLANSLSILRFFLLPALLYYGYQYSLTEQTNILVLVLVIIFLVTLTDFMDGFLARRLKQQTILGRYLDPLADKLVSLCTFSLLTISFGFPLWIFLLYLLRELIGTWAGVFLYFKRNLQGKPNYWGKLGVSLAALLVVWYISLPWLQSKMPLGHWLLDPLPLAYLWLLILLIGILGYARTYSRVIFRGDLP